MVIVHAKRVHKYLSNFNITQEVLLYFFVLLTLIYDFYTD